MSDPSTQDRRCLCGPDGNDVDCPIKAHSDEAWGLASEAMKMQDELDASPSPEDEPDVNEEDVLAEAREWLDDWERFHRQNKRRFGHEGVRGHEECKHHVRSLVTALEAEREKRHLLSENRKGLLRSLESADMAFIEQRRKIARLRSRLDKAVEALESIIKRADPKSLSDANFYAIARRTLTRIKEEGDEY